MCMAFVNTQMLKQRELKIQWFTMSWHTTLLWPSTINLWRSGPHACLYRSSHNGPPAICAMTSNSRSKNLHTITWRPLSFNTPPAMIVSRGLWTAYDSDGIGTADVRQHLLRENARSLWKIGLTDKSISVYISFDVSSVFILYSRLR